MTWIIPSISQVDIDIGLGSHLFNIVKSVGAPLLKEIILLTIKAEAGQVIKDITSGVGVINAIKSGAERAGNQF